MGVRYGCITHAVGEFKTLPDFGVDPMCCLLWMFGAIVHVYKIN